PVCPQVKNSKLVKLRLYNFQNAPQGDIVNVIERELPMFNLLYRSGASVAILWERFRRMMDECLESVPMRTITKRDGPSLDRSIIHLKRGCRRLRSQKNKSRNPQLYLSEITQIEKQIRQSLKIKKNVYMRKLGVFIRTDPSKFWRFMKDSNEPTP